MAISPAVTYSGQVDLSDPVGWPYGAARNVVVPGDGTGTPLEETWLSDLFGFQQALLDAAGLTPTGTPDKVGASQYLDAIEAIIDAHVFSNLTVTGDITCDDLTVGDGLAVTGATDLSGSLAVDGAALFNGNVTLGDTIGDAITVKGVTTFEQSATFEDDLLMGGTLALSGIMTATSGATLLIDPNVNVLVSSPILLSGAGRIRERTVTATDSDLSITPVTADVYEAESLSGNRNWQIDDTGCANGDQIFVTVRTGTNVASIKNPGGTQILILDPAASPPRNSAILRRLAGTWRAFPLAGWVTP